MAAKVESWSSSLPDEPGRPLWMAAGAALLVELAVLTVVGGSGYWLTHPKPAGLDPTKFVEAQFYELPKEAPHLTEEKKIAAPVHQEAVLSKVPDRGKTAKPEENKLDDRNQTESGAPLAPTHGPVAVFSPSPEIPSYLRTQDIRANVVIEFFVNAQGVVTPHLVGSSGNEELDAIAVNTAKKWQFRPAEKDHRPIDAKVRLRIMFDVH